LRGPGTNIIEVQVVGKRLRKTRGKLNEECVVLETCARFGITGKAKRGLKKNPSITSRKLRGDRLKKRKNQHKESRATSQQGTDETKEKEEEESVPIHGGTEN